MSELTKPVIEATNILTPEEVVAVKAYVKGKVHIEAVPAKNDYVDDYHRGTVSFVTDMGNKFNPAALKMRNYSFHNVIIPDGTEVANCNFTQKEPHTHAITGKNLKFKECNLCNVEIDPSWIMEGCLTVHSRYRVDGLDNVHEVERDGKWVEVSREKIEVKEAEVK